MRGRARGICLPNRLRRHALSSARETGARASGSSNGMFGPGSGRPDPCSADPGRSSAPESTTRVTTTSSPGSCSRTRSCGDCVKLASVIVGPDAEIVLPPADDVIVRRAGAAAQFAEHSFAVDYEVEFGVVLGARVKERATGERSQHVFGYTVFNDVALARSSLTMGSETSGRTSTRSARWAVHRHEDELPDGRQFASSRI